MLRMHVLASGSKGNATIVQNTQTGAGVLVDCGISKKALFERCWQTGFDIAHLKAILVTHDHSDHTKGIGVALRGLAKQDIHPVVYVDSAVVHAVKGLRKDLETTEVRDLAMLPEVNAAGMRIFPFATSHDAASSFGFRFECGNDAAGFMTDTGIVTQAAHDALQDVRLLALEANHDPDMLENGPYPYHLQVRIASSSGHLSNVQSATELAALLTNRLEAVAAMHVSQTNNDYELARRSQADALARACHPAKSLCAFQDRPIVLE